MKEVLKSLAVGIPSPLPPPCKALDPNVPHAPRRTPNLSPEDRRQALANALRYFNPADHELLAEEFNKELDDYGHIYMYRLRPTQYEMKAYPITDYPAKSKFAAAMMLMIMNNLDARVAMFPHELITYGGNGGVLNNWGQFCLVMKYLSEMTDHQTLALYSGHPLGLFPSHPDAPRAVITNGMMVPNYSSREQYDRLYAMGCTQYGQMTAGSFCYIGPQGIVHGTTITFRNAGRKYLGVHDLAGKVVLTSGLGGMSGAQGKAGVICRAVVVVAEVDPSALYKRKEQGWLMEVETDVETLLKRVRAAAAAKEAVSIGYLGNVVTVWERLVQEKDNIVHLGSDQTSCHNPFNGGYYPVQLTFEESKKMMTENPDKFKELVQESLRRQVTAINAMAARGLHFWDYGNSFLLEASRAGAQVWAPDDKVRRVNCFRYPSYVQDIMGDVFALGFGPFRWVCSSCLPEDLELTDKIAAETLETLMKDAAIKSQEQISDNLLWIKQAGENKLVVGSQARILYADCEGRQTIAKNFNDAIRDGRLKGPVVLSRDHHDVSGTDSPFRETSDLYDGSALTADMAVQNVIGDSFRGATWVSLHNGGGTGWGEAMNGGFCLVLDGSADAERRAKLMLLWDVMNGVTRRSWSGNACGRETAVRAMSRVEGLKITIPQPVKPEVLQKY
ncbi:urocanate hydratase isoform X1 [Trypanosoma rangeli]|uniref:urocanate hydratase n=1 Tax=Trypanosoma rangeli TaxID=5698 RepID=A0A422P4L7_TRYRA|nr:urocanate hydratase isoform X1 [Trypanosoma rangeli]RNF12670.1 urocanate hydratase isoform X1 [Trypanosoma rangeli]|eukprot:RNF12670.1 urocanate hydratase isoform X1 [Trypanosoma rangeli]